MLPWLTADHRFPPVSSALQEPNGLLAAGGDLTPERLLAAYRRGVFPWYAPGEPILWWSPDPRWALFPGQMKIRRSLVKVLRHKDYIVTSDTAFAAVIMACAAVPRRGQSGTWIDEAMMSAYTQLFQVGSAHSIETWMDGELVGGLYGVAIGRAFFGESMFSRRADASKIALAHLERRMQALNFGIIDCQMETAHLRSLGAVPLARSQYVAAIERLTALADPPWPAAVWRESW